MMPPDGTAIAPPPARLLRLASPPLRGEDVREAQRLLNERGAALVADGVFGPRTEAALRDFQRRAGLVADGILGPRSWAALTAPAAPPAVDVRRVLDAATLAALTQWRRHFPDSVEWRLTRQGLEVAGALAEPSPTEARLAARILSERADAIAAASARFPVPAELVVATICTESSGDPRARRLEPGCDPVDPSRTPHRVSVGLMQTLLSSAREALGDPSLKLAALKDPEVSIRAGMAFIWRQARVTRLDPPLVACAYNAGSIRHQGSPGNRWRMVQFPFGTGKHADRFVRFFTGAMQAVAADPKAVKRPGVTFVELLG